MTSTSKRTLVGLCVVLHLLGMIGAAIRAQEWVRMAGITGEFTELKAADSGSVLFGGIDRGGLWLSLDSGGSWQAVTGSAGSDITSLEVLRWNGQLELLVCGRYSPFLRRSTDLGQTWEPAAENNPINSGNTLQFDRSGRLVSAAVSQ